MTLKHNNFKGLLQIKVILNRWHSPFKRLNSSKTESVNYSSGKTRKFVHCCLLPLPPILATPPGTVQYREWGDWRIFCGARADSRQSDPVPYCETPPLAQLSPTCNFSANTVLRHSWTLPHSGVFSVSFRHGGFLQLPFDEYDGLFRMF